MPSRVEVERIFKTEMFASHGYRSVTENKDAVLKWALTFRAHAIWGWQRGHLLSITGFHFSPAAPRSVCRRLVQVRMPVVLPDGSNQLPVRMNKEQAAGMLFP